MTEALDEIPVRELARLSQSNITPNPVMGFSYAEAGYERAIQPEVMAEEPTLAGEIAAKAGFRMAQFEGTLIEPTTQWFDRSLLALAGEDSNKPRERFATYLLKGRAFGLMALKAASKSNRTLCETTADSAFADCRALEIDPRDPYLTMYSRHYATFESVSLSGNAKLAARTAVQGIGQAIRSKPETNNTPNLANLAKRVRHGIFIGKQVVVNAAVLPLAASKPLSRLPGVSKTRDKYAIWLLN